MPNHPRTDTLGPLPGCIAMRRCRPRGPRCARVAGKKGKRGRGREEATSKQQAQQAWQTFTILRSAVREAPSVSGGCARAQCRAC
eukprot:5969873-Alexandrium_andersonii.AAC.1